MKITFIGAARSVTGSLYLFEFNNQKFLVECGLYQGHREEANRINRTFPFKPKEIKSVVLSHAHIDHSGNLPTLGLCGFTGPIFATPATVDIASLLLLDTAAIQESDIEYLNKRLRKKGLPEQKPLYTVSAAESIIKRFHKIGYGMEFEPISGVRAKFIDAGHILGSASIVIDIGQERLLFTGDLGRKNMPIVRDPSIIKDVDYLIIESTYGGRLHKSFDEMAFELKSLIEEGRRQKSKIIIPSFAVERTQLLITVLKRLSEEGVLKGIPVYIDSPLALDVTQIYEQHPECFDEETYRIFIKTDPFRFPGLYYIRGREESKRLNNLQQAMIIIAGSGMCEGGRVLHHLIHGIENGQNMIVFVGFQARGTLGRKLLDGYERVTIFGDEYKVRARIYFLSGFSAHADGKDLLDYITTIRNHRLKRIFLVHGEADQAIALQEKISSLDRSLPVDIPASMTEIEVR